MRRHVSSIMCVTLIGSALTIFVGCGGGTPRPSSLVQIKGKVVKAGTPVAGVIVAFVPDGDTKGLGADGISDQNGEFTVKHKSGDPGIEPGTYSVQFTQLIKPDGTVVDRNLTGPEMEEMGKKGIGPTRLATASAKIADGSEQQLSFDVADLAKRERAQESQPQTRGIPQRN